MGVMSIMKTDKLLMRKDVKRTTSGRNIREVLLTVMFSFNMLLVPVVHYALITLLSGISIFSWSYVDKTVQPHHFLFLLPFLPFLLAILVQFALYQKYVKPVTPMEQWFAFLSIYIPSRVYLIKNKRQAFFSLILFHQLLWPNSSIRIATSHRHFLLVRRGRLIQWFFYFHG